MTEYKVTLKDVHDIVKSIDNRTQEIEKHCIKTNGKVKLNRWISTTAITLVVVVLGMLLSHIANIGG